MISTVTKRRFWIVNFITASFFLIVAYQLLQLAVIRNSSLLELAEKQHRLSIEIAPLRGRILDRSGRELATNLKVPSIYGVPRLLSRDKLEEMTRKVSLILDLPEDFVRERLSRKKAFVWIKRRVSVEEAKAIRELKTPALGIEEEYRRFYPQGELLSHILGFTDVDTNGLEGIELVLNRQMQGRAGRRYTKRDALGREIRAFEILAIPAVNGHNVTLTIDQYVQYLTEKALNEAYTQWHAQGAFAIVMEVKTGKILAMANRPSFDPNQVANSTVASRRNRALTDMYEPGSVFKVVAASAVLNEGKAMPETIFDCENGEYRYGSKVLHDVHPYGDLSFEDVVVKSSNIGIVKVASLLDPEVFYGYIRAYGFSESTGIDLPGEVAGFIRPPNQWSKTSPYNIPFGHEILVTAMQMTNAMAVIANGGKLFRPYVISKVTDGAGVVIKETKPEILREEVIRPAVAAQMRRILTRVVEEGTGKRAKIDGVSVGGKTGTAQKVLPNGKGYSHSNFVSSFVGFAPSEDPELVMAVVLDDPKPRYYGGTVAGPVFKEVIEASLYYLGFVPREKKTIETKTSLREIPENPPTFLPAEAVGASI
ncbi:MAG: penicillin-binding protein 2 [Candidatus Omnitrophica bacterium]|nr:penicillin-binding protein 2 [Candidatus Omnitrophota bacterium]